MGRTSFLVLLCVTAISRACGSDQRPTVSELITRYEANQDRLESWIIRSVHSRSSRTGSRSERHQRRVCDIRFDGERISVRWDRYDSVSAPPDPIRRSLVWDGRRYINYGGTDDPNRPGTAIVNNTPLDRDVVLLQYGHPCTTNLKHR